VFQFEKDGSPAAEKDVLVGPNGEADLEIWGQNPGVASISAQVTLGTGQTITFSNVADVVVINVDLDVDADRDGIVENNEQDDSGEDTWAYGETAKGAVILCNNDDDDDDDDVDNGNNVVDGTWDVDDVASLVIRKVGLSALPPGWELWLEVSDKSRIRIFPSRTDGATGVIGPAPDPDTDKHQVTNAIAADLAYGMEATSYPDSGFDGLLTVSLILKRADDSVFATDEVQVRVAPWLMLSNIEGAEEVYAVYNPDSNNRPFLNELSGFVWQAGSSYVEIDGDDYRDADGLVDVWPQDEMELGYCEMPGPSAPDVLFDSPRDRGLDD